MQGTNAGDSVEQEPPQHYQGSRSAFIFLPIVAKKAHCKNQHEFVISLSQRGRDITGRNAGKSLALASG
jgi:hypothetical protein